MSKIIVHGQSMYPFIKTLDECICQEFDPCLIGSGDIITYSISGNGTTAIHRVLSVNKKEEYLVTKGDNTLAGSGEMVPFSGVRGKVVTVKRGDRVFALDSFLRRRAGRVIAVLSRHNLTPLLIKRRFLDPVLLVFSKGALYRNTRKLFYRGMFFTVHKSRGGFKVYAFVGGSRSANAAVRMEKEHGVIVDIHVRHRDRNAEFAGRFLERIIETAERRYGPGSDIHVTGSSFIDLF